MAGDDSTATATVQAIQSLRCLVRDVSRLSVSGFKGGFKKDCIDLSRRVALLSHLFEEIRDTQADRRRLHTASCRRSISQLTVALQAAKRLLQFSGIISPVTERAAMEITSQFRGVRCKLEKALANFPCDDFELSEEVKKQINLVRRRYGIRTINAHHHGVESKVPLNADKHPVIPDDFLCPISLELFTDPVFVSTGQTYERSYIQQWIDHGNTTCPNTRQKLNNLTLTPNYVLRSLIAQWCTYHNVKQPRMVENIGSQTIEEQSIPIIPSQIMEEQSIPSQPIEEQNIPSQSIEEQRPYDSMIVFIFMAIYTSALILLIWLFVKK